MKDGDTYRGWDIIIDNFGHGWLAWGERQGISVCSPVCTRRDNAIRALKRIIDDQESGRGCRRILKAWAKTPWEYDDRKLLAAASYGGGEA